MLSYRLSAEEEKVLLYSGKVASHTLTFALYNIVTILTVTLSY